ncbi:hypothetical protein D9Q98_008864 [Chlorella vulgaris]|uniref:tRNA-binding domain-containing protein n=1 Tax=Chlorella vulgaris TaxID=3077 RepID=A0A9D4TIS3_CHLVU|nr:hypothetical protein D9Q98_008864 [Chlorella vulgaris]
MTQLDAALAKIDELIAALRSGALFSTAAPGQAAQPANAPPTVKAKQPKKANKPAAKPASAAVAADTDAFDKAQLAIGRVKSVSDHPSGSEKLWLCKVDVGDGNERQVVAGLRLHVTSEELTGRLVVLVLNLKPAKLAGELSEAMILASEHQPEGGDALVRVLSVADGSQPGDVVFRQGCEAPAGLPDHRGGGVVLARDLAISRVTSLLRDIAACDCDAEPSAYTGAAGIAYALWHVSRQASKFLSVGSEAELLENSERFARAALHSISRQPPDRHGPSLLTGQAGVYCIAALTLGARAGHADSTAGQEAQAVKLRQEQRWCLQQFIALHRFACSTTCQEDEVLYGRSGYLLGCLLLNKQLHPEAVPTEVLQDVVACIVHAGRQCAAAESPPCGSPLFFRWHSRPYLGAAHGMIGPGGEYPTHMGPWREKEPLVHWCHGATGAVFLLCKAHEQLGPSGGYLAAAERSGEAVWQRGLLRKGNGCCHGITGSAYALLRLYHTTKEAKWLHRAVQFAEFMSSEEFLTGARTPDHPLSLYEGSAAEVCLYADLLGDPTRAGFPLARCSSRARCKASEAGGSPQELPPELQGLSVSEDGQHLIDSKTGKVVNDLGATRFDVAVRAMRGDFDPPSWETNTERSSGLLLDSLTHFPSTYEFNLVIKRPQPTSAGGGADSSSTQQQSPEALLERYRSAVAEACAADIALADCTVKERLGGKFVSLSIPATVQAAQVVEIVLQSFDNDPLVMMKY